MPLANIGLVAIGGALGAVARYAADVTLSRLTERAAGLFPVGTLAVNVLGCLAIGLLTPALLPDSAPDPRARLLLITGVLGGFTTYSAFGSQTVALISRGALGTAALNVAAHLILGLGAVWLGNFISRG